ncbi:uncharacterized protein LOC144337176 [Macaca mulatta]
MRRPYELPRAAGPPAGVSFSLPGAARSAAAAASPAPGAQVLESPGGRSVSAWGGKKNTHFFKFQTSDGRGGELTASPLRRGGVTQAAPSPRPGARAPAQVSPGAQSRYRRALAPSARSRRGGFPCEDAHIPEAPEDDLQPALLRTAIPAGGIAGIALGVLIGMALTGTARYFAGVIRSQVPALGPSEVTEPGLSVWRSQRGLLIWELQASLAGTRGTEDQWSRNPVEFSSAR